jgi:hypothetical protein
VEAIFSQICKYFHHSKVRNTTFGVQQYFSQGIDLFKIYAHICNSLGVMTFVSPLFKKLKKDCGIAFRGLKLLTSINKHLIYWKK